MRVVLLSFLLWATFACGSIVMPYSLNFLINAGGTYPPPAYEYPYPGPEALKKLPLIKEKQFNESLNFGRMQIDLLQRLEDTLKASGVTLKRDTPEHGFLINSYPSRETMEIHRIATGIAKASSHLSYVSCVKFGVSEDECAAYVGRFKIPQGKCTDFHNPSCKGTETAKYRTYDGSCNNEKRGSWGRALTGFSRLIHPKYGDGIDQPRLSFKNKQLPSPRTLSIVLNTNLDVPDESRTIALMQWSQFVEHDLVHIPVRKMVHSDTPIDCCDRQGGSLAPRHRHPSCLPIAVSRNDPFYGSHWTTCMSYVRSALTFRSDCSYGASEQMNQASHFLDGSQIYGANKKDALLLRKNQGGLMKESKLGDNSFLPEMESSYGKEYCQLDEDDSTCFKSGDLRVNMHPHLTAFHVLWLREHNRIARKLFEFNPTWNDETLYQEARRITIAQIQHITYNHWLPVMIGKKYNERFEAFDGQYDGNINPSVTNSFATAGLRYINSMLVEKIDLYDENRNVTETLELVEHFNNPKIVIQKDKLSQIIRGMATQPSETLDLNMIDDVSQLLYRVKNAVGLDIFSIDIQRGRDHGIPPYNQYRTLCGLKNAVEFKDFSDVIPENIIEQLKRVYTHPQDVDLIVGALAERPQPKSYLGHTLACILGEQFSRTRSGDRYFYTNVDQPEPFLQRQLEQIEKATLARIICDNIPEIKAIQRDVFSVPSESNEIVSCEGHRIRRVNIAAWQDPNHKPDIVTRTKRNVDKWMNQV